MAVIIWPSLFECQETAGGLRDCADDAPTWSLAGGVRICLGEVKIRNSVNIDLLALVDSV